MKSITESPWTFIDRITNAYNASNNYLDFNKANVKNKQQRNPDTTAAKKQTQLLLLQQQNRQVIK